MCLKSCGGPGRVRTVDLFHAMEARSQLRHRPTFAADRQTPDRENSTLAGTRFQKALQGYRSVTEYSTSPPECELTVRFTRCLQWNDAVPPRPDLPGRRLPAFRRVFIVLCPPPPDRPQGGQQYTTAADRRPADAAR